MISDKAHERFAQEVQRRAATFIIGTDWKVIPLENLIAALQGTVDIIAGVKSFEEAKTALETWNTVRTACSSIPTICHKSQKRSNLRINRSTSSSWCPPP